jgi:tetratricopeptide (TPR) repeat protein
LGRIVFKISVGFVTGALIVLAISLYLSDRYLTEQLRLAEAGDLQGARGDINWAARLDPFSPAPMTALAYLESRQGRTEAAADAFQQAIDREPVDFENYVALGDFQMQQLGDPGAAVGSYREALSYNPHATGAVSRLAEALLSSRDLEGAREQYEWLREQDEISLKELYALGKIQVQLDEPEEAIKTYEEARQKASADIDSLDESAKSERQTFIESLDLATANALVVERSYDAARQVLLQSSSGQAKTVLTLLGEDPEGYRRSVLDNPVG